MAVLLAYAGLAAVVACTALVRRGPTLWRAKALRRLHVVVLGAATVHLLALDRAPGSATLAAGALALAALAAGRRRWWILRAEPAHVTRALEECLETVRAPFRRLDGVYRIEQRDEEPVTVAVGAGPAGSTVLRVGAARRTRKTQLGLNLLAKGFPGLFPRVRLTLAR